MNKNIIRVILLVCIILNMVVLKSEAKTIEGYENKYFWKFDVLGYAVGGGYDLEAKQFGIIGQISLLEYSIISAKMRLGVGIKLYMFTFYEELPLPGMFGPDREDYFHFGDTVLPLYLYYMPFHGTHDRILHGKKSGESVLSRRKITPVLIYVGCALKDTEAIVSDIGISWSPFGFMELKIGYANVYIEGPLASMFEEIYSEDPYSSHINYYRGLYIYFNINFGTGWKAVTKP